MTQAEELLTIQWKAADRQRQNFQQEGYRLIKRALDRQIAPVIRAVEEGQTDPEALARLFNDDPVREAFQVLYPLVGASFARDTFREIRSGKAKSFGRGYTVKEPELIQLASKALQRQCDREPVLHSVFQTKAGEPVSDWLNFMRAYALREAGNRIRQIGETTLKHIRRVLGMAVDEGYGIDKTAKLMTQEFEQINKMRARLISRTEILSSSAAGSIEGARSTGLPMDKIWISTRDKRTRTRPDAEYDHVAADQEQVDLNAPFVKTGEEMDYPGDPKGSPANSIQCRCAIGFKPRGLSF